MFNHPLIGLTVFIDCYGLGKVLEMSEDLNRAKVRFNNGKSKWVTMDEIETVE